MDISADECGPSAIGFAIVGPVFIFLLIGIFYLCMGLSVAGSMHYAVEEGARCASVRTLVCSDDSTTISYTQSHYFGPSTAPNFTYNAAAAYGHSVIWSIRSMVVFMLKQISVPITIHAYF